MKGMTKLVVALALSTTLTGCKSIFGLSVFSRHARPPVTLVNVTPPATGSTQAGRSELDADRPGAAIEKFRKALGDGEPMAPALNGLAVAYARIGRHDLAQRYFEEAVASDPLDQRYQANLAALMQSPAVAMRRSAAAAPAPITSTAASVAAPAYRPGQLQRVSRAEVRIASAQAYPAPYGIARAGMARNLVETQSDIKSFVPAIRLQLPAARVANQRMAARDTGREASRGFTPIVRIVMANPRPLARTAVAGGAAGLQRER